MGKLLQQAFSTSAPQQPQQTQTAQPKSESFISRNLPAIGGIAGGLALAPFTGGLSLIPALALGATGAAAGAAAGTAAHQKIQGEKLNAKEIGKEALLSGAGEVIGGGLGRAAGSLITKGAKAVSGLTGRAVESAAETGAKSVLKTTPSAVAKAAEHGKSLTGIFRKYAPTIGNSYDEMLGSTAEKRMGGNIGRMIGEAEDVIQNTAKTAGNNIKIQTAGSKSVQSKLTTTGLTKLTKEGLASLKNGSKIYDKDIGLFTVRSDNTGRYILKAADGTEIPNVMGSDLLNFKVVSPTSKVITTDRIPSNEIIDSLKKEAAKMGNELGGEQRKAALEKIIQQAEGKYKNGLTVEEALNSLRAANAKFGASIIDDTSDAVATAAQKLEANTLRSSLKKMFPSIADSLDTQSDLIQLREVLKVAAAKGDAGLGFKTGKLDITKPGTFIDSILNNPNVATRLAQSGGNAIPSSPKIAINPLLSEATKQTVGRPIAGAMLLPQDPNEAVLNETQTLPADTSQIELPQDEPTIGGLTYNQLQKAAEWDLMNNQGKGLPAIKNMMDMIPVAAKAPKLTDTAIKTVNDNQTAMSALDNLRSSIEQSNSIGPVAGYRALNPYDTSARSLQAEIDAVRQTVGRALEGGVLRKEDEEKYKKILPTVNDTKAVAIAKINYLMNRMQANTENYSGLQNTKGGGSFNLNSDISQALTQ